MSDRNILSIVQENRFVDGLARVARPIEHNANYHEILGERLSTFYGRYGFGDGDLINTPEDVLTLLDRSMLNKRLAVQMLPPRVAAVWGKTRNNLREFEFLRSVLRRNDLDDQLFNVSHHRIVLNTRMSSLTITPALRELFRTYVQTHWPISRACIFQLINYVHAYMNWVMTFRSSPALPRVLVLANDHSPNQVACTAVAQDLCVPVIYIQHAEVTRAFPPLVFDLSILRNHASLDVYKSVGPVSGIAHVVSRDTTPFRPERFAQASSGEIVVGVYLTAQVLWEGVRRVIACLRENSSVDSVFVKPHPSQPVEVLKAELPGVSYRRDFLPQPHVAVVANSSVVVELLHGGNIVFQNYSMDAVPRDYYGFSSAGIAPEVEINDLQRAFWLDFSADEKWRQAYQVYDPWALDDYLENEKQLSQDLKNFFPAVQAEQQAISAVKPNKKSASFAGNSDLLCRAMLISAPNTVIDYVNEPQRFASGHWCNKTAHLDFVGALEGIFADRVTNSYELFAISRRVRRVASELVYTSKRRDIELTGRSTDPLELDEMSVYVQTKDLDLANRWRYDIQFLMLLLRLKEEDRIRDLFSSLPPLPARKLGINHRVALVNWLRDNPRAQLALNLVPAQFYAGLAAFQRLKLFVLTATPAMYEKRGWTHEEIEQQFLELASPGAKGELATIFLDCYDKVRSRMQFMDVRWSLSQRQAFYALVEKALNTEKSFSLVRLSDREAYMFAEGGRYFTKADVENCERHWWRMQLPPSEREKLTQQMREASRNADVLGVPCIYRLLRQTDVKTKSLLTSLQGRGLAEVAHYVAGSANTHQLLAEEKCNVPLFSDFEMVLRLCNAAKRTVLIASASECEVRRLFQTISLLEYIAIPTHSRTMSNHKYAVTDKSLPEVYGDIRHQISATVKPGDLVLVAAGVIGKIFVDDAKQAGGVALDVGTCLDSWVGAGIHSLH